MSKNGERLKNILDSNIKRTGRSMTPVTLELGTINGSLALVTDSISDPIPQKEYMVSLHLTHETYYSYNELNSSAKAPHTHSGGEHSGHESGTGSHTHNDGLHDHRVPSVFRRLKAGDRVLVAWVGNEPVVVDILVSGETITKN